MKKFTLLAVAMICALSVSAQKIQVKSGGSVIFEKNVGEIEKMNFVSEDADPCVAFKQENLSLNWSESAALTDIMSFHRATVDDITIYSSNPSLVAIEDGKVVAKNFGTAIITAKTEDMTEPTTMNVSVESNAVMYVAETSTDKLNGTSVKGTVLAGRFYSGQPIIHGSYTDTSGEQSMAIRSISARGLMVTSAQTGNYATFYLSQRMMSGEINVGDIIYTKGNSDIVHKKKLKGTCYVLTEAEGGGTTVLTVGSSIQAYVETASFTATIASMYNDKGVAMIGILPGGRCNNVHITFPDDVTPYTYLGQVIQLQNDGVTVARFTITGYDE